MATADVLGRALQHYTMQDLREYTVGKIRDKKEKDSLTTYSSTTYSTIIFVSKDHIIKRFLVDVACGDLFTILYLKNLYSWAKCNPLFKNEKLKTSCCDLLKVA